MEAINLEWGSYEAFRRDVATRFERGISKRGQRLAAAIFVMSLIAPRCSN
jgi:hypothetical protein